MVVWLVLGDDLVGFVVLIYDFGKGLMLLEEWLCYIMYEQCGLVLLWVLCDWLKILLEYCQFVEVVCCDYFNVYCIDELCDVIVFELLVCCDVFCCFECIVWIVVCCEVDKCGWLGFEESDYLQGVMFMWLYQVVLVVQVCDLDIQGFVGFVIGEVLVWVCIKVISVVC